MKISCNNIATGICVFAVAFLFSCTKDTISKSYAAPQITLSTGDKRLAETDIHFSKDTTYILATDMNRYEGQTLLIDAGTLIKVNDGVAITINPGATIEATGTAMEPIVFTSSATEGTAGYTGTFGNSSEHSWAGISISGNGDSTSSGSGVLIYVRIEFASGSVNNDALAPALQLNNVTKGTTIQNVQVSYAVAWGSFKISGGNFDAKNLVSYASRLSDFVLTDGYKGRLQNVLAYRHPYFVPFTAAAITDGSTVAGLLISGLGTFPSISNMTVVGPGNVTGSNQKYFDTTSSGPFNSVRGSIVAPLAITGGEFHIRNSAFEGFPKTGIYLGNFIPASSLLAGTSDFNYSTVQCPDQQRGFYLFPNTLPPYTSYDFTDYTLNQSFGNQLYFDESQLMLTDPYNYDVNPNPFPETGSPLLSGANFDGPVFNDPFFTKTAYRGALGIDNWLQGWTNFLPLQTNYNN